MRWVGQRPALAALLLFAVLTVIHTWPLARDPGGNSRVDNGDMMLNAWIVAWVAHQLPRDPLHLFDANIFWPERRTLAYSEPLIVPAVAVLPVTWLGGSAVLAHNLSMLVGFATTGWAFCLLSRRWTGSWGAGLVAGSLAAFNAHTLTRLAHLQAHYLGFLALALYAFDRLLTERRVGDAVRLGAAVALQAMASIYLVVFAGWALVLGATVRSEWWRRPGRVRAVLLVALAALVCVVVGGPVLAQYARVRHDLGFVRSAEHARLYASSWTDYLYTGGHVHYPSWSRRFGESQAANFPGVVATALALVALGRRSAWREPRMRMSVAILAGAVVLSVAPWLPGFAWMHEWVPMMGAIRNYSRFGQLALVALAILAGFGVARISERLGPGPRSALAVVVLVTLANVEALRAPLGYERYTGIPAAYVALEREPQAVVAELPVFPTRHISISARYVLNSTAHWRPIVNGYSGFIPPSYERWIEAADDFPSDRSVSALHALGVTHVVVHGEWFGAMYGPERLGAVSRSAVLRLLAETGDVRVFRLGS